MIAWIAGTFAEVLHGYQCPSPRWLFPILNYPQLFRCRTQECVTSTFCSFPSRLVMTPQHSFRCDQMPFGCLKNDLNLIAKKASTCFQQLGSWFKSQKVCETTFPRPPFPQVYPPRSWLTIYRELNNNLTCQVLPKYSFSHISHCNKPHFGIVCFGNKIKAGFHPNLSNVRWLWKVRLCCRLISELNPGPKSWCLSVVCISMLCFNELDIASQKGARIKKGWNYHIRKNSQTLKLVEKSIKWQASFCRREINFAESQHQPGETFWVGDGHLFAPKTSAFEPRLFQRLPINATTFRNPWGRSLS